MTLEINSWDNEPTVITNKHGRANYVGWIKSVFTLNKWNSRESVISRDVTSTLSFQAMEFCVLVHAIIH